MTIGIKVICQQCGTDMQKAAALNIFTCRLCLCMVEVIVVTGGGK